MVPRGEKCFCSDHQHTTNMAAVTSRVNQQQFMKYLTFSLDADVKGFKVVVTFSSVFYFHVNHVYTLAVVVCFTQLITWINRYFYKQKRLTVSIPEGPKVQLIRQKFL